MKIEIWSDFACPFCFIGEKKLNSALTESGMQTTEVDISFRSFQLNINAVSHKGEDINTLIASKYGISYERAKAANDNIVNMAKEVGLQFDFYKIQPGNTGMAHEVYKYSETVGKSREMAERIFSAYFEEGKDISDETELLELAEEVGIKTEDLQDALKEKEYRKEVLNDQDVAAKMGINGVPFFVINDKYTISGAQSIEHFKKVLEEAKN